MTHHNIQTFALPAAVAAAGAFIGIGIYFGSISIASRIGTPAPAAPQAASLSKKPAPLTSKDHIRGSSSAKVIVYEYSDLECPFCKSYHSTLKTVLAKYPSSDVAWVYRHYPLPSHDRAPKEAEASECAAEQGGHASFWAYIDRLFEVSPTNNGLDPKELPKIAAHVGLNVPAFEKCLSSGKYASKVAEQAKEGASLGITGTPHSFVVGPNGYFTAIKGAVPAAGLSQKIDEALKNK